MLESLQSLREINIDVQKSAELLQQSLKPHGAPSMRWSFLRFVDFCACNDGCSERRVPGKQSAVIQAAVIQRARLVLEKLDQVRSQCYVSDVEGWGEEPLLSGKIMSLCSRNVSFREGIAGFASL